MKKVILTDDKNNTVHDFSFGSLSCDHVPLDDGEYEVVDSDMETTCLNCIFMDEVYRKGAKVISDEMDKEFLDELKKAIDEGE